MVGLVFPGWQARGEQMQRQDGPDLVCSHGAADRKHAQGHLDGVLSVAWSPNGERVASGAEQHGPDLGCSHGRVPARAQGAAILCGWSRFPERRARGGRELRRHGPDLGCQDGGPDRRCAPGPCYVSCRSHFPRMARMWRPGAAPRSGSGRQPRSSRSETRSRVTAILSGRSRGPRTASAWRAGAGTTRSASGMQPRGSRSETRSRGTAMLLTRSHFPRTASAWQAGLGQHGPYLGCGTGQLQQTLEGHSDNVSSVAFRAASACERELTKRSGSGMHAVGFIPSLGMQAISCTIFRAEVRVLSFGTFFPTYPLDHCQLSKSLP